MDFRVTSFLKLLSTVETIIVRMTSYGSALVTIPLISITGWFYRKFLTALFALSCAPTHLSSHQNYMVQEAGEMSNSRLVKGVVVHVVMVKERT